MVNGNITCERVSRFPTGLETHQVGIKIAPVTCQVSSQVKNAFELACSIGT